MLPVFVQSGYKRYKKDTSIFIKWLVETAKECGYEMQDVKKKTAPKSQSWRIVPLKDIIPLAEAIARSESPLIVGE